MTGSRLPDGCSYHVFSSRPLPSQALDALRGYRVGYAGEGLDELEEARRSIVYINWFRRLDRDFFRDPGCVRLVIARSSGYDHIDVDAAERAGVCVANQPEVIAEAVAETAVAGILAVLRRIVAGHEYVGAWAREGWPRHLRGGLVWGRSVGLLGVGRIGSRVAFILASMGAGPFYYYSRTPNRALEQALAARRVGLEELFSKSMIVVNSLPLTPETRGIVTRSLLSRLPRGAVYANVGRGATEEPGAVCSVALERPDLGFYLDVHPEEPLAEGHPRLSLASRPNVVLTPHFAGYSEESMIGTSILAALQARRFLEEGCVWNPVVGSCKRCPEGPPSLSQVIVESREEASR